MSALTCVVFLLRKSFSDLLLLHSWGNKIFKTSLKKKLVFLLIRNAPMKERNIHNTNTAVLCLELCCVFPYLESSSCKERFMFLQAFNLKKVPL